MRSPSTSTHAVHIVYHIACRRTALTLDVRGQQILSRNIDVIEVMRETLDATASKPPEMDTSLAFCPSANSLALSNSSVQFVQHGRDANAARRVDIMSAEDEFRELRQQMLILRNSNLTQYEREGSTVAHSDIATLDNKYGFLCTMETLESELVELEDAQNPCLSSDAAVAKYRDMMDKIDENHRETTTADLFSAAASSKAAAAAEGEKKALALNPNGEPVVEKS